MQIDDRFRAANIKQVEIERIVKSIIKDQLLLVYYIVFGKELVKAKNKHKGEMLRQEVEILQNKWSSRGLNTDLMDVIKNALSVPYDMGLTEAQANLLYWRLDCTNDPSIGYWIHQGNFKITGNLELNGNLTDNGNSVTVANIKTAYDHSQVTHDYAYITANDGATNVTAAELEELSDGSVTVLHDHDVTGLTNWPVINYAYVSGNDAGTNVTAAELEELSDGSTTVLHNHNVAAGADTEVQYNDGGAVAGAPGLVYDKTNARVGIGGAAAVGIAGETCKVTGSFYGTADIKLDDPPRARMYKNAAQNIPSGGAAATKVDFDADSYDSGNITDPTVGYDITPAKAGYYLINASVKVNPTVDAKYYRIYVYINGALKARCDYMAGSATLLSSTITTIQYVGAGEAIDIRFYHNTGVNIAVQTGHNVTWFEVHRLS